MIWGTHETDIAKQIHVYSKTPGKVMHHIRKPTEHNSRHGINNRTLHMSMHYKGIRLPVILQNTISKGDPCLLCHSCTFHNSRRTHNNNDYCDNLTISTTQGQSITNMIIMTLLHFPQLKENS